MRIKVTDETHSERFASRREPHLPQQDNLRHTDARALRQTLRRPLRAIAELIPDGAAVLDLCCGPATLYTRYLREKSVDYVGLDLNSGFIARLNNLGGRGEVWGLHADTKLPRGRHCHHAGNYVSLSPQTSAGDRSLLAAARKQVIVAELVRNMASCDNRVLATLGRRFTNAGDGEQAHRFTETTLDELFRGYAPRVVRQALIAGGRESSTYSAPDPPPSRPPAGCSICEQPVFSPYSNMCYWIFRLSGNRSGYCGGNCQIRTARLSRLPMHFDAFRPYRPGGRVGGQQCSGVLSETSHPAYARRMTFDVYGLAPGLERGADGIWFARRQEPVSYPQSGHAACLQIEDRSFWYRHRNRCIASVVRRFPPQGALLDIGGGNGYVAKGLIEAGIACALVEPGIDGAVAARARGVDPVICARLEDIGMTPGSVSAAGMFDVLEHIENDADALQQVHALLRPGGLLFLTVPAYAFLHSADDVADGHFRRYTLRSLMRAVISSGFRPEYATYLFAPLPPFILLLRTLPSLLGLRRPADAELLQVSEHVRQGFSGRMISRLLDIEAKRIGMGGTIPFGTSCLAVCIKD